jgi:putative transposase
MPVMHSIPKNKRKWKTKVIQKRDMTKAMLEELKTDDLNIKAALIQALIPAGLECVCEELQKEVINLVGERYKHGKVNTRWGSQPGSVYLQEQKIPLMVPRVRNKELSRDIPLKMYQSLQNPYLSDKQTILKLLNGISTHKYQRCAELVPAVFGISPSNLSRRFKKNTGDMIRMLKTRSLSDYDFVCVFIDGKRYAKDGLLVSLGITIDGKKIILDIEHSHTENSQVMSQLIDKLIERGLRFEEGLLWIVDGSKGIINAIKSKLQEYAFIQRCQYHKQQNVTGYLNDAQQQIVKNKLKQAYKKTTYKEAHASLSALYRELSNVNISAANSLQEGLEETLTLHSLGLSPELCKSLNSTNCIESIMSQLGQYTDKVDRWHNSYQLLRWTGASLLEIEPRLNKIHGHRYLHLLRHKMKQEIKRRQENKYGSIKQKEPVLEAVEA